MLIRLDLISTALYIGIIVAVCFAIWAEWKDIKNQVAISEGHPHHADSHRDLKHKIRETARYDLNSIYWRRSLIVASISAFLVSSIALKKIPDGITLASGFLVTYILIYLMCTCFQKWLAVPAVAQVDELTSRL